ncbi:helix-turn-helix domain-containing protein [Paraburkholderia acidisoli]|uniref:HTH cro/C1-type domain-containing protein n=1 Tax=Paraburkholderia acidisoli TaxID=2571748 RepID=A0A7Z2GQZ5_9BURK|nr:helix-turn-helix transcriptional regulator [Paraburkholderia acidisoli]QGZ66303.1 hypothetical protein FAZ98_31405 [Paraburkholderia acidisoli]QGZ66391.1 hypothetical protein FAZ98_31900 [Paraburkholderia acidisoli]
MDIQHIVLELKRLGMTQAEIAASVHCAQSTISEIQNGKIGKARPSYQLVTDLQQLLRQRQIEANEITDVESSDDVQPPIGGSSGKEKLARAATI